MVILIARHVSRWLHYIMYKKIVYGYFIIFDNVICNKGVKSVIISYTKKRMHIRQTTTPFVEFEEQVENMYIRN